MFAVICPPTSLCVSKFLPIAIPPNAAANAVAVPIIPAFVPFTPALASAAVANVAPALVPKVAIKLGTTKLTLLPIILGIVYAILSKKPASEPCPWTNASFNLYFLLTYSSSISFWLATLSSVADSISLNWFWLSLNNSKAWGSLGSSCFNNLLLVAIFNCALVIW